MEKLPSPRRVLEIGPGTGPCTTALLKVLGPEDTLDLVELNESFVAYLERRFQRDPRWNRAKVPWKIHSGSLLDVELQPGYDAVVSSLPFSNFEPDLVRLLIDKSIQLTRPGGNYVFYEYFALRPIKMCFSTPSERSRLRAVQEVLREVLDEKETHRKVVFANLPPALTHHLVN